MKNFLTICLSLFITTSILAQQDILPHVYSKYYTADRNILRSVASVNDLNNTISKGYYGLEFPNLIESLSPNSAYFRTRYPLNISSGAVGLINISWHPQSQKLSSAAIEELATNFFDALTLSGEEETRIIKYVKNDSLQAGYMYDLANYDIYFVVLSVAKREMVRGSIKISLLTSELREALIEDFIQNIKFEPYPYRRRLP